MKQAFLIICHNQFDVLRVLVSRLDDERHDIYIHFDRKVKCLPLINVSKSKLYILNNRIDVRWGHTSQILAEIELLRVANSNGPYRHYSIISGTHLPLVSNDKLDEYSIIHRNESVLKLWKPNPGDMNFKFGRYHFFVKGCYSSLPVVRSVSNIAWRALLKIQSVMGIRNNQMNCPLIKADQWCMLSQDAANYLLTEFDSDLYGFRYTLCSDEYFIGTKLKSGGYTIYNDQKLLYTEFRGYSPRVFTLSDYDELVKTGCLFARKFSK